jgi:hypothetical protein
MSASRPCAVAQARTTRRRSTSWTGHTYRHHRPEVAVAPVRPTELAHAAAADADLVQYQSLVDHSKVMDENYDEDRALPDWYRSLRRLHQRAPRPAADPSRRSSNPPSVNALREPPPF